jgi:hypothetical protein
MLGSERGLGAACPDQAKHSNKGLEESDEAEASEGKTETAGKGLGYDREWETGNVVRGGC